MMPTDFNGYLSQLTDALKRAKQSKDPQAIEWAKKSFDMIMEDIEGVATVQAEEKQEEPMSYRMNEQVEKWKRLF